MFNIIIIGGEDAPSYEFFREKCIKLLKGKAKSGERIRILTIGDEYVTKFASQYGIETKTFYCNWKSDGKDALYNRNKAIMSEANAILYFSTDKKDLNFLFQYAIIKKIICRRIKIE